jgi:hypothetical protein
VVWVVKSVLGSKISQSLVERIILGLHDSPYLGRS